MNFNDNLLNNESEQDANSVSMELDKGLRSLKVGEQCEAIVRFPRLFEKYPFPILINSSFLKLGEFFRVGSNLVRLWILKVCQQSENHLEKILSTDEFVRRIFVVIHSNDPVARALTLRTLGAVARVIPEKVQIHHSIRGCLDSHDEVEIEAAIYASSCFAAQSKEFSISMCSKIGSMIESFQTPVSMKLMLIPVLQHMHHDAKTAALAKTLCLNLLPKYPAENFVINIIDSLTKLSCNMLINVPDQVELCLKYAMDPRRKVRYQAFKSLLVLAKKGANVWPSGSLRKLIISANAYEEANEKSLVLIVIVQLIECPIICHALITDDQSQILELCSSCLVLDNQKAASHALSILAAVLKFCHTEGIKPPSIFLELIHIHFESLIQTTLGKVRYTRELKKFLICGVTLAEVDTEFSENFVQMIGDLLSDDVVYPTKHSVLMCEALAALCSKFHLQRFEFTETEIMEVDEEADITPPAKKANPVTERLPQLIKKFESILKSNTKSDQLIEILSAVILQSIVGCFMPQIILDCFEKALKFTNFWTNYRIGRTASRYGQHYLAAKIFSKIANHTSMDRYHFFMVGLTQMSKAECILNYGLEYEVIGRDYKMCDPQLSKDHPAIISIIDRLDMATTLYWKALASMRASSSPSTPLTFQQEFIKLRGQYLQALFTVVTAKNAQTIVPPPGIAASLAQNSRDYLQKFGHITNQLRKVVKAVKGCEEAYEKLYSSSFDADPTTLEFLEASQYQIALFGNILETICYATPSDPPSASIEGKYPETKFLMYMCHRMNLIGSQLPQEAQNAKTISYKHMEVVMNEIELISKFPICMPRFFFQVLQSTQIKLSITPQPKSSGEAITVQSGSNLVVKVEGVIQHCGKSPSLYRSIESIRINLVSQLTTPRMPNEMKSTSDTVTLIQTVKPNRDFLSGSFLVPLNNIQIGPMGAPMSVGGQWQVTLETFIIDENGIVWSSGQKTTLLVRVPEDPSKNTGGSVAGTSNQTRRF